MSNETKETALTDAELDQVVGGLFLPLIPPDPIRAGGTPPDPIRVLGMVPPDPIRGIVPPDPVRVR